MAPEYRASQVVVHRRREATVISSHFCEVTEGVVTESGVVLAHKEPAIHGNARARNGRQATENVMRECRAVPFGVFLVERQPTIVCCHNCRDRDR